MVGLGSVDNTADLEKPISTATQNALNTKMTTGGSIALGGANILDYTLNMNNLGFLAASGTFTCNGEHLTKNHVLATSSTTTRIIKLPDMTGLWAGFWISFTIFNRYGISAASTAGGAHNVTFQTSAAVTIHTLACPATVNAGTAIKFVWYGDASGGTTATITQTGGWIVCI